jgi:hypothetical protein
VQVNDTASEAALAQKLELGANVARLYTLPPPTMIGVRKSWHSSTKPAAIALLASSAPPNVMSRSAESLSRAIAAGSNSRSIRVRALDSV